MQSDRDDDVKGAVIAPETVYSVRDGLRFAVLLAMSLPVPARFPARPRLRRRRPRRSRWPRRWCCSTRSMTSTRGVTRAKLAVYGGLLLAIGLVGGFFRFLMRRIIIGASRNIEYDMRNDFFAHLQRCRSAYFQAQPHRRSDVARDQRPQRRADDDRPGGDVLREHGAGVRRRARR